jgi:archaemetzincin
LTIECVHEIGHLRGAVHCTLPGCVMNFSGSVEEIDLTSAVPCDDCRPTVLPAAKPTQISRSIKL